MNTATETTSEVSNDFDAWFWNGIPTEAERQAEFNAWLWGVEYTPATGTEDC